MDEAYRGEKHCKGPFHEGKQRNTLMRHVAHYRMSIARACALIGIFIAAAGGLHHAAEDRQDPEAPIDLWPVLKIYLNQVPKEGMSYFDDPVRIDGGELVSERLLNADMIFNDAIRVSLGSMELLVPRSVERMSVRPRDSGVSCGIRLRVPDCSMSISTDDSDFRMRHLHDISRLGDIAVSAASVLGVRPYTLRSDAISQLGRIMMNTDLKVVRKLFSVKTSDITSAEEHSAAVAAAAALVARDHLFGICKGGVVREVILEEVVLLMSIWQDRGFSTAYSCYVYDRETERALMHAFIDIPNEFGYQIDDVAMLVNYMLILDEE